ncbi:amino acid transporter [Niabella ginsenosidivorans]|uniref:Amino acid transporter n=1 Tax=Niabella ginsenosidivorans TaxID=1176587 RepID=A0A1A9I144_9BACT|nr:amino acid permease [Niabella ginsenosidivorans]ANH81055.1 amino acid transporter [Niabella ginsenosidivorans]
MGASIFRKKKIENILAEPNEEGHHSLNKILTVKDLTFLGIAAVVGAGIFSTIGSAAYHGGPGVSLLFIITAVTCGFSALCYAEFASRVPVSGSAYTYSYISFGEVIAWVIGWALILEYAIGNIVVAISWSGYFNNLLVHIFHIHLPGWLLIDPETAVNAYHSSVKALSENTGSLTAAQISSYNFAIKSYTEAPQIGGMKVFLNLPAFFITALITWVAFVGIKESKQSANFMVLFKIAVIIFIIVAGSFFVDTNNWIPFLPNRFEGVLKGVSAVFYAYIGFDAISTTAEECRNPQRDLPKSMIYSLVICTVLYIAVALVLTGIEKYSSFKDVTDPLAFVFEKRAPWIEKIVSVSAVVATTSVLLVFQIGQPRIWMSMSRDGLLPKIFRKIHPKYKTPSFSTLLTGIIVGLGALFLESSLVTDLTSIGTLFAFILVGGGLLVLPPVKKETGKFKIPYINGRYIVPFLLALFIYCFRSRLVNALEHIGTESYQEVLFLLFLVIAAVITILTILRSYSFVPVMGVLSCLYLLIEIPAISWLWFFVWMAIGLIIYFLYGYRHSNLAKKRA